MDLIGNVNKRVAAEFFGVTTQALDGWFTAGCPVAKRGSDGAIMELDLSEMAKWRLERGRQTKRLPDVEAPKDSGVERLRNIVKSFSCEILVPCLVNDFRADAKRIAKFAAVSEEQVIRVWSMWTIANFDSLQRLFEDPDIAVKHTAYTRRELEAAGERASLRKSKPKKAKP